MDKDTLDFLNKLSREIVRQIQEFEEELPQDKQVGVVINGAVIAVQHVIRLFQFGRLVICGLCTTEAPLLNKGDAVRVVLQPQLPSLTLTAIRRTESAPRRKIGIETQKVLPEED